MVFWVFFVNMYICVIIIELNGVLGEYCKFWFSVICEVGSVWFS